MQGPKGWQAQNVTGPGGAPCIGSPTTPPHKQLGSSPPSSMLSSRQNSISGTSMMLGGPAGLRRFSAIGDMNQTASPTSAPPIDLAAGVPIFYSPFAYGMGPIGLGSPQSVMQALPGDQSNGTRRRSSVAQGGMNGHDSGYYSAATSPMHTPRECRFNLAPPSAP
jgi:hypothetical protein